MNDWISLVVCIVCACICIILNVRNFKRLPKEEQIIKVKEWLIYAVIMAEKQFGSGTGVLKLRYVYNMFIEKFPELVSLVSFTEFSEWVDQMLEYTRYLLETNLDIKAFVEEDSNGV